MYTQDEIMNEHIFYRDGELYCDDVPVREIVQEMGTPLYIYSKAILEKKYHAIADAFSDIETTICFAVKSCSSLPILTILHDLGSGFDIVSGGELFRIVNCSNDTSKVVFSGVGKTDKEIKYALEKGVLLFNIECVAELSNINLIAGQMNVTAPVGIRINPDVDPHTHKKTTTGKKENKFGIDFITAAKIIENLSSYPNISLKAFSMHIGSPVYSTQPYADALDGILEFMDSRSDLPDTLEYIDSGGGFGLLYNDETVPDFTDYADVIIPRVKKSGLKLILEPGRSIAGNAGVLIATALYRKSNSRKNFIITDAGMHSLLRPAMYGSYHGIWPVKGQTPILPAGIMSEECKMEPSDIVGPICESSDTFCENRMLPPIDRGDLVAIFSAGAYGFTMSNNYNSHPRPAEVMVDSASWRVIHLREDWESLVFRESR